MGGSIVQRPKSALVVMLAALSMSALASDAVRAPSSGPAAPGAGDLLDRSWTFRERASLCVLEQLLPGYGAVRFFGRQGEGVSFELTAGRDRFAAGPLAVHQVAPDWHAAFPERRALGEVLHIADGAALGGDPLASRLLSALEQGYAGELSGASRFDARASFAVVFSPLGFASAHRAFAGCLNGQGAGSWLAVERSRLFYRADDWSISDSHRGRLQTLANFVRSDPTISRVFVDGHTDDIGTPAENLKLSKRRADEVAKFLETEGVPRERLVVRYHGERYPVAPNDSDTNRAENRRTTIRLSREPAKALVQR